jgi:hypothetical protein
MGGFSLLMHVFITERAISQRYSTNTCIYARQVYLLIALVMTSQ